MVSATKVQYHCASALIHRTPHFQNDISHRFLTSLPVSFMLFLYPETNWYQNIPDKVGMLLTSNKFLEENEVQPRYYFRQMWFCLETMMRHS